MIRSGVALFGLALLTACSPKEAPAPAASASMPASPIETVAPAPSPSETAQATPEATPMQPPMITGGFAPADSASADVKAALSLATAELYKKFPQRALVEKSSAEVQVVAGLNYRFDIQMTGGKHYTAVVYKPLQGDMKASSVEEAK